MIDEALYIGLGRESGGSRGSSTTDAQEETPPGAYSGGSYTSSEGEVEQWYFDAATGRKYYTKGDKAGTYEQVAEPRKANAAGAASEESDNQWIWLLLPLAAAGIVYYSKQHKSKTKRRKK